MIDDQVVLSSVELLSHYPPQIEVLEGKRARGGRSGHDETKKKTKSKFICLASSVMPKTVKRPSEKRKKRHKRNYSSYSSYIYKVCTVLMV